MCFRCGDPRHLEITPQITPQIIPETIAQEADRLVNGDRQGDYGHPLDDFSKTALIWQAILGISVTAEQVALCMVGVKLSREMNKHKRDNLVDGIGYFVTLEKVIEERERRAGIAEAQSQVY